MTFKEWILSSYENPDINGQWGARHIIVLILCIGLIVAFAFLFRNKNERTRKIVLYSLVGLILFFEIMRRVLNLIRHEHVTLDDYLYTLLPRPWCAISCWMCIISVFVNKKFFYNITSITALLCAVIFFAYPGAGFNNKYILFENLYSISTHALILITSITLITLRFADFRYNGIWKEAITLAVIFIYAFIEIYVLHTSDDPLYFMPNNDVQDILGLSYPAFLVIYIVFMLVWVNAFYLINDRKTVFCKKQKIK